MGALWSLLKIDFYQKSRFGGFQTQFWSLRASILRPQGSILEGSEPMFSRFPDILAMPLIVILLWIQTSFHEGFEMVEIVVHLNLKLKSVVAVRPRRDSRSVNNFARIDWNGTSRWIHPLIITPCHTLPKNFWPEIFWPKIFRPKILI